MSDLVLVEPSPSADDERWQGGLALVGAWLLEQSGNTRIAYADSIGWPYTPSGNPRKTPPRYGASWLGWCYRNHLDLFAARRLHVLAWIEAVDAARHPVKNTPLETRSKAHMISAVSAFYTWAMQEGHTEVNPAALVNRKKKKMSASQEASPTRSLSVIEVAHLLDAADRDLVESVRLRSSAIMWLLFNVGLRVSELCNLNLSDRVVLDGDWALRVTLKGDRVHDEALPDAALERLERYLTSRHDIVKVPARRGDVSADVPMFVTNRGERMNRREVLRLVKRLAKAAGLRSPETVHPHVARHSFASEARRRDIEDSRLQNHFGHLQGATTARYGQHVANVANSPAHVVAASYAEAVQKLRDDERD